MNAGLKIVIIVLAAPILLLGLRTMIDPTAAEFGLALEGVTGPNSMRSMFPGVWPEAL